MIQVHKTNSKLVFLLPLLVYLSCYLISRTTIYQRGHRWLDLAILGDLLVTAPLLYLVFQKRSTFSLVVLARWMMGGILMAGVILQTRDNGFLSFLKFWVSPLLELGLIAFIAIKFVQAKKLVRATSGEEADFLFLSRKILHNVTGNRRIGDLLGSEIALWYYVFASREQADLKTKFTSYKETGIVLILGVFLSLMLIETCGMHLLISIWNSTAAWVFTVLGLYTCLQFFAHLRSLGSRLTTLTDEGIYVKYGFAGDVFIPYQQILEIGIDKKPKPAFGSVKLGLFNVIENTNIRIRTHQPLIVTKIFGIQKISADLYFQIDQPEAFVQAIKIRTHIETGTSTDRDRGQGL